MRAPGATGEAVDVAALQVSYRGIITKEDALTLVQSYDLPSLTEIIEPRER